MNIFLQTILIAGILIPLFPGYLSMNIAYMIIRVFYLSSLMLYVYTVLKKDKFSVSYSSVIWIPSMFLLLTIVSLIRDHQNVILNDNFELLKPVSVSIILIVFSMKKLESFDFRKYIMSLEVIFVALIIIGYLQYFLWDELKNFFFFFTTRQERIVLHKKAIGTFHTTYPYGFVMLFSSIFNFISFIFLKKKKHLLLFLFSTVAVLLSQSRTQLLTLFSFLLLFCIFYLVQKKFPNKKIVLLIAGFFLFILIPIIATNLSFFDENFHYVVWGFSSLINKGLAGHSSAGIRLKQFSKAIQFQDQFPLIGKGIGKGYIPGLESFYSLYLYRYGLSGMLLYIFSMFYIIIDSYKLAKASIFTNPKISAFLLSLCFFILLLPLSLFSSAMTEFPKIDLFFYSMVGVYLGLKSSNQKVNNG